MERKRLLIWGSIVIGAAVVIALLASGLIGDVSGLLHSVSMPMDGYHP